MKGQADSNNRFPVLNVGTEHPEWAVEVHWAIRSSLFEKINSDSRFHVDKLLYPCFFNINCALSMNHKTRWWCSLQTFSTGNWQSCKIFWASKHVKCCGLPSNFYFRVDIESVHCSLFTKNLNIFSLKGLICTTSPSWNTILSWNFESRIIGVVCCILKLVY